MSSEPVIVNVAEIAAVKGARTLACFGLGACVSICAFDPQAKVAGMAYVMLPEGEAVEGSTMRAKYANVAVPALLETMKEQGAQIDQVRVALVGGSGMLDSSSPMVLFGIGSRNVEAVKNALEHYHLQVIATDLGGSQGRAVTLSAETGHVSVRSFAEGEKLLCDLRAFSEFPQAA